MWLAALGSLIAYFLEDKPPDVSCKVKKMLKNIKMCFHLFSVHFGNCPCGDHLHNWSLVFQRTTK